MSSTKMLINASRSEMLRVAIVEGTNLQEYQVEIAEGGLSRGNIYRGIVANIQPSLNAAFIDIGEERHAFLPVADVLPSAYHRQLGDDNKRPRIDQVLEKGKAIVVQVTKDGVGQKGAAVTTNIALAGRYLVLTPFDDVRGISRKAEDGDERKAVRDRLKKLALPDGCGVIVRTNGLEQNQVTLTRDLNALLRLWKNINAEVQQGHGSKLIYSDQDLVVQALRDYLDPEIAQVIVDNDEVFQKVDEYMKAFMPRSKTKLVRYTERLPLFSRYRVETQVDRIYERSAPLPSGGTIVIDPTEALTAIDVNSGRATRTVDHDESIFNINCEAAHEVARQLRLRDIGGIVVVDFIDMRLRKHQNKLEKVMREAMKFDKARYSVGRISPNGLLEINRQRIKQALRLRTHRPCTTCQGLGSIPSPEFAALRLLSRIESRAATGLVKSVTIALHPEIADALQNGHRRELAAIENENSIQVQIVSAPSLGRNEDRTDWVERDAAEVPALIKAAPAIRAADLSRPEEPSEAAPTKTRERKTVTKVEGSEGTAEGEAEKRRRRRRRRRRRTGTEEGTTDNGEAALLDGNQEDGSDQDDAEDAAEAMVAEAGSVEPSAAVGTAEAESAELAAEDEESEDNEENEAENGAEASSGEAGTPEAGRRKRRRRGGRGRRKRGTVATPENTPDAEAAPVIIADDDGFIDEPQPPAAVLERAEAEARSGRRKRGPSAGGPAGGRRRKGEGGGPRRPEDFEERQPLSNESALHRHQPVAAPVTAPIPTAPIDRTASHRLRWQWWGGGDEPGGPGPDRDE